MLRRDPDKEWEKFGKDDPYYGVLVLDKFHKAALDQNALVEFFRSGQEHVDYILRTIRTFRPDFAPSSALDFGCGVGRCVLPLAHVCPRVVGVDVSPSMIEEARRNCVAQGLTNVELLTSLDGQSGAKDTFDLIHSVFVFQLIPNERGMELFAQLVHKLSDRGVGVVDFLIHRQRPGLASTMGFLRRSVPFFNNLANLLYGKPFAEPLMEKLVYDINPILKILHDAGCGNVHVKTFVNGSQLDSLVFFEKKLDRVPHEAFFADPSADVNPKVS